MSNPSFYHPFPLPLLLIQMLVLPVYSPVAFPLRTLQPSRECLAKGICKIASASSLVNKEHPARWIYDQLYPFSKPFLPATVSSSPIRCSRN
ncbi:hypothetical protein V6Z12_A10G118100 [Gossypium hirsutum]